MSRGEERRGARPAEGRSAEECPCAGQDDREAAAAEPRRHQGACRQDFAAMVAVVAAPEASGATAHEDGEWSGAYLLDWVWSGAVK